MPKINAEVLDRLYGFMVIFHLMNVNLTLWTNSPLGVKIFTLLILCRGLCFGANFFSPDLKWQTLESPHFLIHFHQGESDLAKKVAGIAEDVHTRLCKRLKWTPRDRTHIILIDTVDEGMGWATPIPRNTIIITATPTLLRSMINFDDWLRLVIVHEYTHILHLDTIHGVPSVLQKIFGRIVLPNLIQPAWLIEGFATFEETQLTNFGRGRSTFFDMILRVQTQKERFNSIDQASHFFASWPGRILPYLYGVEFYKFVADRYGEEAWTEVSQRYASSLFTLPVQSTARRVFGKNYHQLFSEWRMYLREKYRKQIDEIKRSPITESCGLTDRGYLILSPTYSPDGDIIAFIEYNEDEYPSLKVIDHLTRNEVVLLRGILNPGLAFSPNGKMLAFSQRKVWKNFYLYDDIFLYKFKTGEITRITEGARARDPAFSPDGKRLIFVKNKLGRGDLAVIDLLSGRTTQITHTQDQTQYFMPRFSPDGKRVAVSRWMSGGYLDICLIDTSDWIVRPITADRAIDIHPVWSRDGRFVLFTSDRTGVFNIYAYSVSEDKIFKITNVLSGAFFPAPSPKGRTLCFVKYGVNGFDLHLMEYKEETWSKAQPFRDTFPFQPYSELPQIPCTLYPYKASQSFLPTFWIPVLRLDSGGLCPGVFTQAQDVLRRHLILASLFYGLQSRKTFFNIQYTFSGFYPDISVYLVDEEKEVKRDTWERQWGLGTKVSFLVRRIDSSILFDLGYEFGGQIKSKKRVRNAKITLSTIFNNTKRYGFSISNDEGREVLLKFDWHDRSFLSDKMLKKYWLSWKEYFPLPKLHQVLAIRSTLGAAFGGEGAQNAFRLGGENTLRGYPKGSLKGQYVGVISVEYRFPLRNEERGWGTFPFFLHRSHGSIFCDLGGAFREIDLSYVKVGVGGSVGVDATFLYHKPIRLSFSAARGLSKDGEFQFWIQAEGGL